MTRITPDLLSDTYHLVQLARETARARGDQAKAERLTPVAAELHNLAAAARQPAPAPAQAGSLVGQPDFQSLLAVVQSAPAAAPASAFAGRSQAAAAMSAAGMPVVDIARHLRMTQQEIQMILQMGPGNRPGTEALK